MEEEQLKEAFNVFDKDGSGEISARELFNLLTKVFSDRSQDDVKAISGVSIF